MNPEPETDPAPSLRRRVRDHFAARLAGDDPERGDVPGWVLVTLMSAGLVSALWVVAEPELAGLLRTALDSVSAP